MPERDIARGEFDALVWLEVESSNITRIAWAASHDDLKVGVLYVEFVGGRAYAYDDVAAELHTEFVSAESIGRFFAAHVKPNFEGHRLAVVEDDDDAA